MTRRWPDTLPPPSIPGFRLQPRDQVLRTDMEVGARRVRRISQTRLDFVSAPFRFDAAQSTAFRAWYYDDKVSLAGDSDSIAHWSRTNATLGAGAGLSPDLIPADRLIATAVGGLHNATLALPDAALDGLELVAWATLQAAGVTQAKLVIIGRDEVYRGAEVNLTTGATGAVDSGVTCVVRPRGTGWRVELHATVGAGSATPQLRVALMDGAGSNSWTGNGVDGVDVSETQARVVTGQDLFIPCDAGGKARGMAGGAAWARMAVAVEGREVLSEVRLSEPYAMQLMSALAGEVTLAMEVRNA